MTPESTVKLLPTYGASAAAVSVMAPGPITLTLPGPALLLIPSLMTVVPVPRTPRTLPPTAIVEPLNVREVPVSAT